MIAGKIIFSGLGLSLSLHPLGLILGCMVGHLADLWWQKRYVPGRRTAATWQEFSHYSILLAARVAKADGAVSKAEIRAFKNNTNYQGADEMLIGQLFNHGWRLQHSESELIHRLGRLGRQNPLRLQQLMSMLEAVARAGTFSEAQQALLTQAARGWGLSGEQYTNGGEEARTHQQTSASASELTAAYKTLGVKQGTDIKAIKTAYRKQVQANHPDKLRASGASAASLKRAEAQIRAVNAAWELIQRQRH